MRHFNERHPEIWLDDVRSMIGGEDSTAILHQHSWQWFQDWIDDEDRATLVALFDPVEGVLASEPFGIKALIDAAVSCRRCLSPDVAGWLVYFLAAHGVLDQGERGGYWLSDFYVWSTALCGSWFTTDVAPVLPHLIQINFYLNAVRVVFEDGSWRTTLFGEGIERLPALCTRFPSYAVAFTELVRRHNAAVGAAKYLRVPMPCG